MTITDYRPAYNLVRDMLAEHGGTMDYIKKGEGHDGSWFIKVLDKQTVFPVRDHRCPGIDELHIRKPGLRTNTWDDFENILLPNAWDLLLDYIKSPIYYETGDDQEYLDR